VPEREDAVAAEAVDIRIAFEVGDDRAFGGRLDMVEPADPQKRDLGRVTWL